MAMRRKYPGGVTSPACFSSVTALRLRHVFDTDYTYRQTASRTEAQPRVPASSETGIYAVYRLELKTGSTSQGRDHWLLKS